MKKRLLVLLFIFILLATSGCQSADYSGEILKIATTTSLDNSGLLISILPDFEKKYDVDLNVIAVGTGQALALGERGDVDLVLVHAPDLEVAFVEAGYGTRRNIIMYNDFVILGPASDPANISELLSSADAFNNIAKTNSVFISRGDQSGTHYKENQIWAQAGLNPENHGDWFNSVGQGMGASLVLANEKEGYILSDRGTFLAQMENLPNLTVLFGGQSSDKNPDVLLKNTYSAIPVNPQNFDNINIELSELFVEWISSIEIQEKINEFGVEEFGIPLFYPNSIEWNSQN